MKILVFTAFLFFTFKAGAQKSESRDSLYYLIDTAKVPVNARMWEIHLESPALKFYSIECPCLEYDQKPTFVYSINTDKGQVITKAQLNGLKLITLISLIEKAKQSAAFRKKYDLFIVEPYGNKFIHHKALMLRPAQPHIFNDYIVIPKPDSLKSKKPE